MILDVNNSEVIDQVNRLERVKRRSMPYAIRFTLNDVAFDTRKWQLKKEREQFTVRKENFFESRTNVKKATGNSVESMSSESGIFAKNNSKKEQPVHNLALQEKGGSGFAGSVPTKEARGGNNKKTIPTKNRLRAAKVRVGKGDSKRNYIARHAVAARTGKVIKSRSAIYRVTGFYQASGGRIAFNKELLYVRHYGKANYRKRPFVRPRDQYIQKHMNDAFNKNIQKQLDYIYK